MKKEHICLLKIHNMSFTACNTSPTHVRTLQSRGDIATCLVTGNLEPIGWGKMAALGIHHLFTTPNFGGFGSDFCSGNTQEMWRDRCEFVKLAEQRWRECCPAVEGACWLVGKLCGEACISLLARERVGTPESFKTLSQNLGLIT